MTALRLLCLTAVVLTTACSAGSAGGQPGAGKPAPAATMSGVRLVEVAQLDTPVAMATRTGDPALYVLEQAGRVRRILSGKLDSQPALDITKQVKSGGELGLLGVAFAPDGRHLYLDYTDQSMSTNIVEYAVGAGGIDATSRRVLLTIRQPYPNHKGGQLAFGPDGDLYIGLGDGGSEGDPQGNGQNLQTLLGKILRISPAAAGGRPYGIPAGNPFVNRTDARPEIWSYGLRNPWRFSFDEQTGDLWIGDVGQNMWEEVDHVAAGQGGQNFGWNRLEGNHPYRGTAPDGAVAPVIEYPHQDGACTVIGGPVYRGRAVPGLTGSYIYGDYCAGWIDAVPIVGTLMGQPQRLPVSLTNLSSFGTDPEGNLYAMATTGQLDRFAPA